MTITRMTCACALAARWSGAACHGVSGAGTASQASRTGAGRREAGPASTNLSPAIGGCTGKPFVASAA